MQPEQAQPGLSLSPGSHSTAGFPPTPIMDGHVQLPTLDSKAGGVADEDPIQSLLRNASANGMQLDAPSMGRAATIRASTGPPATPRHEH